MSHVLRNLVIMASIAGVVAYGAIKFDRGKMQAYEVMLASDLQAQSRLGKCVAKQDIACVERELDALRSETESFISHLESQGISDRMRGNIVAYREAQTSAP